MKGSFKKLIADQYGSYELEMNLKLTNLGKISGTAKYPHKEDEIHEVKINGGFYSSRFLKLDYENSNKAVLQFGAFVFKLSSDSKTITGCFIGYGHKNEVIAGGETILSKIK